MLQDEQECVVPQKHRKELPSLSLSLLHGMSDMPLYRAAEQLGMSTSYLKAACRRLGIARWPRAGRSIGGVAKPNSRAQVNINYSRQIYRKYVSRSEASKIQETDNNISSDQPLEALRNSLEQLSEEKINSIAPNLEWNFDADLNQQLTVYPDLELSLWDSPSGTANHPGTCEEQQFGDWEAWTAAGSDPAWPAEPRLGEGVDFD